MGSDKRHRIEKPFRFYSRVHLLELTGLKVSNLEGLLEHIKTIDGASIYHHTHHFLQQHQFSSPEPPNDFAFWVTKALNDKRLGEKLAAINICEFGSINTLRQSIVHTLETYLKAHPEAANRSVVEGDEFYFLKSVSFVFPLPYEVQSLEAFAEVIRKITIHSIYFHMFEARLRMAKGTNDFSYWLETAAWEGELAKQIARLDPYTFTMESLRKKIIELIEKRINL
ncbi:MAG: hypothetical protein COV74_02685 [Candidatus Omnitrophica bacterium CG11_big_fil_rev_8_21_14_0_20_45_26]|uniref:Uncharacterized protein n=1 Tax=Candidatus Abzuiibacterium crystallinum TaxID=1974748 RepID=A0A2H0LRE4_9BACT|nr:MAG: hypothetical protein COV74_02685 [Candidatus Omnitrophica bacterium CG11_big_fil_rev_8_21_14_0_20_45_26]PIW65572.1 MAG: hypothetical protein COW12_01235 [Candidatus Omnitrophica bacterium CG12_big_fil_rev_8_21_14_0_65_45_16]